MPNPEIEQISAAQKASAEVLMTIMRTSFEGMQRLSELNMAAAQEAFSSTVATSGKLATSKDMSDVSRVSQQMAKPERLMEYWRNIYDLVSAMQKEVSAVMQVNYGQLTKTAASAIEKKQSSAMDGSDMITNVMKSMLEQTNKAFDNMTAITSQMTDIANANIRTATAVTEKAVGSVTEIASKK
jgi:phasin family protein